MIELLSINEVRAILVIISSMLISFYAIPIIINIARSKHLFDMPNGRTSHLVKTPTLGGIAIFASLVVPLALFIDTSVFIGFQYFLASLTIVFFTGLKDDLIDISATKKFIAQIAAAFIIVVLADIRLSDFHGFLGIHGLNYYVSVIITIIAIVGLINGFNLIDGIDGLASGIGIVTALTFGIYFAYVGEWEFFILSLALIGSLIAFFRYNVFSKKLKLFMGDTGSLILGLTLAVLMIRFNEINIPGTKNAYITAAPAVSFGILIIPLFDTIRVIFIRLLNGNSPFKPDKIHLHHYLLELGFSHFRATLFIIFGNIIIILFAFALQSLRIGLLTALIIAFSSLGTLVLILVKNKKVIKAVEEVNKSEQANSSQEGIEKKNLNKPNPKVKLNLKNSKILETSKN